VLYGCIRAASRPVNKNTFIREKKMPKMKTKSSAKKRFRVTGSGKVKMGQAGKQHGMRKRSNKMIRNARGTIMMKDMEVKRIKTFYLPGQ